MNIVYGWNRLGKKSVFSPWRRCTRSGHDTSDSGAGEACAAVAQLPPCLIGMEACSGAHERARRFATFGHSVKLMAPKFVAPYRKGGKNDGNDAEAICEAVARPNMRFVPIKSIEEQADLTLHRVRQGFVRANRH
jgi:transposase